MDAALSDSADGLDAGEPWIFTAEQLRFLLWWYAIDETGRFVYRSGVLRRMKGWGKDPFAATIAGVEFVGPRRFAGWDAHKLPVAVPHPAAWVQCAAVSKDQTRNTMTLFPGLFSKAAISEYGIDLGKEIIYSRKGGRIEAVTSSPRALEGARASLVIKNDLMSCKEYHVYLRHNQAENHPARVSWLTWAVMTGIGFVAQLIDAGGAGSLGQRHHIHLLLRYFLAALFIGDHSLTRLDRASLTGAALAMAIWPFTNDPLASVVIVTSIDSLGYVPTFRKTHRLPYGETLSNYVLSAVKFALAALAMEQFTLVTAMFPVTLLLVDIAFVTMVLIRRKQLALSVT